MSVWLWTGFNVGGDGGSFVLCGLAMGRTERVYVPVPAPAFVGCRLQVSRRWSYRHRQSIGLRACYWPTHYHYWTHARYYHHFHR